jgi:hypothetical protein
MPRTNPWYSILPFILVHHNNTRCTEGNNIEPRNRRSGTESRFATTAQLSTRRGADLVEGHLPARSGGFVVDYRPRPPNRVDRKPVLLGDCECTEALATAAVEPHRRLRKGVTLAAFA